MLTLATRPYAILTSWVARHPKVFLGIAFAPAVVSILFGGLFGGRTAVILGRIQFISVVLVVYVAIICLLFSDYRGGIGRLLTVNYVRVISAVICTALGVVAAWIVVFTLGTIFSGAV